MVIIDILGFRGIWRRPGCDYDAVIGRLEELRDEAAREARAINEERSDDRMIQLVEPTFISDTVVFGVLPRSPQQVNLSETARTFGLTFDDRAVASNAIASAARLTVGLQLKALTGRPAFAFRGCIAFGDFGMKEHFIIGEAVDNAASEMNDPQGAFVSLHPSAEQYVRPGKWWEHYPVMRYDVPIKRRGARTRTGPRLTVVPLGRGHGLEVVSPRFEATFVAADPSDAEVVNDVAAKKIKTLAFLREASATALPKAHDYARQALDPEATGGK